MSSFASCWLLEVEVEVVSCHGDGAALPFWVAITFTSFFLSFFLQATTNDDAKRQQKQRESSCPTPRQSVSQSARKEKRNNEALRCPLASCGCATAWGLAAGLTLQLVGMEKNTENTVTATDTARSCNSSKEQRAKSKGEELCRPLVGSCCFNATRMLPYEL